MQLLTNFLPCYRTSYQLFNNQQLSSMFSILSAFLSAFSNQSFGLSSIYRYRCTLSMKKAYEALTSYMWIDVTGLANRLPSTHGFLFTIGVTCMIRVSCCWRVSCISGRSYFLAGSLDLDKALALLFIPSLVAVLFPLDDLWRMVSQDGF